MTFFSLTFLSWHYLFGVGAAAIPLIIHLSRSRRTKKMRFSTTRFFTDQFLRSYRMSRLKELILLACRMALFALFAMALAQPLYAPKERPAAAAGGEGSRSVVLVIDNSASMGYTEKGRTLLDRARTAARTVLDGLKAGDRATVVLAGRRQAGPEVLFPHFTDQLNDVRAAIDRLDVSFLGTDLTAAVALAEKLAAPATTASREVYVFSDLQDSGWEMSDDKAAPSDTSKVSFVFVRVRPEEKVVNRAVTAVRYASPRPMVGVPFAIRPLLSFTGDDSREVVVRLVVDGEKVGEQRLEQLPNGRWAMPRFYHTFKTGGPHSGYIEVDDSVLPQDNRRHFALEVLETVKVLAVNGAPSQVPRLDELFFLRLALTAAPEDQKSPIDVDAIGTAGVAAADLAKYPLVILANVESLPAAAVEKLEDFVDGGGSLLVFLGDKVNANFYNETLAGANRRSGGLLPAKLVAVEGNPAEGKDVAFIGGADFDHPALSAFQDTRNATLVGPSVAFKALWKTEVPAANLLMKASNGLPLLAEKDFGKGRVMLFTSTCDRDWTNFPIRPIFLPWTHRLVAYLAQQSGGQQTFHQTGDLVRLHSPSPDPGAPVLVKKPNGVVSTAAPSAEEAQTYLFNETALPGAYAVLTSDQKGDAARFAVNLENYESDLTYLDEVLANRPDAPPDASPAEKVEAGLKKLLNRPLVTFVEDPLKVGEATSVARHGRQLWDYFLMVVLVIGLFEPWLANRISARLYGRARPAPEIAVPGAGARTVALPSTPAELVEGRTR
jgi:uncharacterized membrane protein